jgi:hypothetical protein
MSYKSKIIALLVLAICFQACRTMKKNLEAGISATMDRMVIVPAAVARFATDVSKKIYSNDSLKDETSVVIDTFDVKFYNQKDSFQMQINNISFYWLRDSLHYKNFIFPKWDIMKYADTMRGVFDCSYRIPGKDQIQCLSGEYSIINRKIEKIGEFKPCMQ